MAAPRGRRVVFNASFGLNIVAFVLLFVAFSSPYWFQSWPRVYSPFKNIGLWEACFAGLVLPIDPRQKAYHGCWWTLAEEYMEIRDWLMPWWFIITQILCTISFLCEFVNLILQLYTWVVTNPDNDDGMGKARPPIRAIQMTTIIVILTTILKSAMVILFGSAVYLDHYWMPKPELNYLSWSYGVAVLSAFCSIFSCFATVPYHKFANEELATPPPPGVGVAHAHPQMGHAYPQMGHAHPQMGHAHPQMGQAHPPMVPQVRDSKI